MTGECERAAVRGIGRRGFLAGAVAAAVPLLRSGISEAAGELPSPDASVPSGMIIRQREPENLESPFAALDGPIVPNDRFYVRNHFAAPALDVRNYKLRVEGTVERPLEIGYEELRSLGAEKRVALLECAGNGRVFLTPTAKGVAWGLGAVGTAEWTGVPLAAVLERAGIKPSAVDVVLEGADSGEIKDEPRAPGVLHYARSLPRAKALHPGVLLAYEMNGKPLPRAHGYPVRALVPGWYAMASVKWLSRIVAVEKRFEGYFQTLDYSYWERQRGLPARVPIGELQVKSQIARPAFREVVRAGSEYRIHGAAWTGDSDVSRVQISTDRGTTWQDARLLPGAERFAWRLWDYSWRTPANPARLTLMSRATDKAGRTQPLQHDKDRGAYMINMTLPIEVEVR